MSIVRCVVRLVYGAAVVVALAHSVTAQDRPAVLTGIVQNTDTSHNKVETGLSDAPVTFCAVVLTRPRNCLTLVTTTTDSQGRFMIVLPALVPKQTYSLQVQFQNVGIKEVRLGTVETKDRWLTEQTIQLNRLDFAQPTTSTYPLTPSTEIDGRGGSTSAAATGVKRVFFATDRAVTNNSTRVLLANAHSPNAKVVFGSCFVTVDLQQSLTDKLLSVLRDHDATRGYAVRGISLAAHDLFMRDIAEAMKAASNHDALLFVHGYNVSFDEACRRAAQLAYDIKFQGQVILYSWPSHASVFGYGGDEEMTQWSQPHFNAFYKELLGRAEISHLHVIAHSMGNRLITEALFGNILSEKEKSHIGEVVLAAPDVNRLIFDEYTRFSKRVTLYASDHDQALRLSKLFHGYARVGDAQPDIATKAGIDSMDASAVDTSLLGHSYIGDARSVIADVAALIPSGTPPEKRFGTVKAGSSPKEWWVIRP